MVCEMIDFAHSSFLFSDFISALLLATGTIFLMRFLRVLGGERFRGPAVMIGTGMILFAVLHEFGEFLCGAGIHGGNPATLFGTAHILVLGSLGAVMFLIGCYQLQKRYAEYVKK